MKERFSNEKAKWSNERENSFRKKCEEMAFSVKAKLILRDGKTYLLIEKSEVFLCEPVKQKSMWYETWIKFKTLLSQ